MRRARGNSGPFQMLEQGYYWIRVKHYWDEESDDPEVAFFEPHDEYPEWLKCGTEVGVPHGDHVVVLSGPLKL